MKPIALAQPVSQQQHVQLALEQAALHATQLAISRWTSGHSRGELRLARSCTQSSRARWNDCAQDNFKLWLKAGGFAQTQPEDTVSA